MLIEAKATSNVEINLHIPSFLVNNKELSITEKFLLGMIEALTAQKGYCYATNKFFAEKLDVKPTYISKLISKLTKLGYIIAKYAKNNEFYEYSGRRLYLSEKVKNFYSKTIKKKNKTPNTTVQLSKTTSTKKDKSFLVSVDKKNKHGETSRFKSMSKAKTEGLNYELKNCSEEQVKDVAIHINQLTPGAKQKLEDQVAIIRPIVDDIVDEVPVDKLKECISSLFIRKEGRALNSLRKKKISYLLTDFREEIIAIYNESSEFDSMFDDSKWGY